MLQSCVFIIFSFVKWIELSKEDARNRPKTALPKMKRCPSCRADMKTWTPMFSLGVVRHETQTNEYPPRPISGKSAH